MKKVLVVIVAVVLASCSSSHDVVHSGFLQKRKYKKGYHLSLKKKEKKQKEELLVLHEDEAIKNNYNGVKGFNVNSDKEESHGELKEYSDLIVSVNEDSEMYAASVVEKTLSLNVEGTLVKEDVKTASNSGKQESRMFGARFFKTFGLSLLSLAALISVFSLITSYYLFIFLAPVLPLVFVFFLLSVQLLLNYTKNRMIQKENLDVANNEIENQFSEVKRHSYTNYFSLGFGLLMVVVAALGINGFEIGAIGAGAVILGVVAFLVFIINLFPLTIKYFKLFKLIKKEDKIGGKYRKI